MPSAQHCCGTSGALRSARLERHGWIGDSPAEDCQDGPGSGEQDKHREADGDESVHPGEGEIFLCVFDYLIGTYRNTQSD